MLEDIDLEILYQHIGKLYLNVISNIEPNKFNSVHKVVTENQDFSTLELPKTTLINVKELRAGFNENLSFMRKYHYEKATPGQVQSVVNMFINRLLDAQLKSSDEHIFIEKTLKNTQPEEIAAMLSKNTSVNVITKTSQNAASFFGHSSSKIVISDVLSIKPSLSFNNY